jgi:LPXTG-motif cell wall-anchored protein
VEGEETMRTSITLLGTLVAVLVLAIPAFAVEDGIIDTSSTTPNEDLTHADFTRVITNTTEGPVDIAPRDLRSPEYPILTVTSITVGTFDDGIWTIGTLEGGQTASITYTGDAAPGETTTTTEPTSIAATAAAVTTTAAPEELPHTGQRDNLAVSTFAGLALIGLGASMLWATRD